MRVLNNRELADECSKVSLDGWLGLCADDGLDDFTVLEDLHRGDGGDLVQSCGLRVLVNVELDDVDFVAILEQNLVENGANGAAGATPFCPEVNEYGLGTCEDLGCECRIGHCGCS